ncbi:MAG: MFS transporter [Spirochaetales bacterium]|nr:MFS transporter [Spirochaetales bacterium]
MFSEKKSSLKELTNRSLLTVYLASFFIFMQLLISLTLYPLYIRYRGGSDFMIGLQSSIFTLFSVAFRLYFGPMADTLGRKSPLLIGAFVFGTAPILVWLSPDFFWMSLARIYQAIGMATFLSAASSTVADMVSSEIRGAAIGVYRSVASLSVLIGPSIGLWLITSYGYSYFFIFVSGISLTAMFLLSIVSLPEKGKNEDRPNVKVRDLVSLFRDINLRACYTGITLTSIASGIILSFTAVYFLTLENIIPTSLFFSIYALSGMISSTFSGQLSDKIGRMKVVVPAMVLFSLGIILLGLPQLLGRWTLIFSAILFGMGYPSCISVLTSWVVDSAPDGLRASALSFQESSIDIGNTIGILFFGILASGFYYGPLFVGLGLITITYPLILITVRR